jgi:aspartate oxidase
MTSKLLKGLEKGLKLLKNHIKEHKNVIIAKLNQKEKVSSDEEIWLDNKGNTVDEDRVVDVLKRAHTPKRVLNEMDAAGKEVVRKLQELGGDIPKLARNRHKCKCLVVSSPDAVEAEEL